MDKYLGAAAHGFDNVIVTVDFIFLTINLLLRCPKNKSVTHISFVHDKGF